MPAEAAPPAMPRPIGAVALAALTGNGSAAAGPHALFDVREPGEAHRGHVFGATCLPLRLLEFRIAELVRDPATPIVVYDDATGRAQQAAATLAALGYRDVAWLDGGIDAWRAAGQRPATGNNVPSKRFGETVHAGFHVPAITPAELQQWRRAGRDVVVCDVRTPEEYAESCIPGAFVGAGFDLVQGAAGLARRHEVVVVNCAGRTRSIIAARTLAELGVANVVALENGTMGWRLAGLEVETGAGRELDPPSPADLDEARRASRALADAAGIARCDAAALAGLLAEPHRNRYVLDVRRVADYVRGHVPGSLALPGGQAVQRADDFLCVKSAPVVLVDEHGIQANVAAVWLSRMGYPDVRVLEGGLPAWRAAGGALATGKARDGPQGWAAALAAARPVPVAACAAHIAANPDALVLDVGTSRAFRRGHLPGAAWLPRGWLAARIDALAGTRDRPLVVSCEDGMQGVYAGAQLRALGYTAVTVLDGGKRAWSAAGMPLATAALPPQDDELIPPYKQGEQAMRDYIAWEVLLVDPAAA